MTDQPDNYDVTSGTWDVDMEWVDGGPTSRPVTGDGYIKFNATTPGSNPVMRSDWFPLEGGRIWKAEAIVQASSVSAGNTLAAYIRVDKWQLPKVYDTTYAINGLVDSINTWERHEAYFKTVDEGTLGQVFLSKANNAFTAYYDSFNIYPAKAAFRAYCSSATALAATSWTKVNFQTESYDHVTVFDSSTNYRFVAPYPARYAFSAVVRMDGSISGSGFAVEFRKNGSSPSGAYLHNEIAGSNFPAYGGSSEFYLDKGDYIEVYAYNGDSSTRYTDTGSNVCWFAGHEI